MTIYDILKDSTYKTEQFSTEAIDKLNEKITVKEDKNGKNTQQLYVLSVKRKFD